MWLCRRLCQGSASGATPVKLSDLVAWRFGEDLDAKFKHECAQSFHI